MLSVKVGQFGLVNGPLIGRCLTSWQLYTVLIVCDVPWVLSMDTVGVPKSE